MQRLDHSLELYQEGAVYMRTHWEVFFIVLGITVLQRLSFFVVTWFICLALGQHQTPVWEVVMLQSFVSVCIDILPMPGGVGVNEGFFVTIFRQIMSRSTAVSAMFLSRGINFYILMIAGAGVAVYTSMKNIGKQQNGK